MTSDTRLCCYLSSRELGGMEQSLATLLELLPPRFDVVLLGVSADVLDHVARARPGTAVQVVPPVRGKADLAAIAAQVRALRAIRPHVLHASLGQLYHAQYPLFAAWVTRTPAVAVVHGVYPRAARRQDALFRWLVRRTPVVAGVSRYVAESIEAEFRLPNGTARVLYNGVAAPEPPHPPEPGDGRRPFLVGAVGRLAPEKGFDVLVRAVATLPDCRLVILGDGPGRGDLLRLARQLGVDDRVELPGWVDPPWTAAWSFDVLAAPSAFEGFGLVAVEAMLAGVPVVASDVGGFSEVIDHGVTGVLVTPGDPAALAAAVGELASDASRRAAIADRGRAAVTGRFTPEAMAGAYVELFDEVRRR